MAITYYTAEGDTADYIAWLHYKTQAGRVVERLLEANPGLAAHGPTLPAGLSVSVPDYQPAPTKGAIKLWD